MTFTALVRRTRRTSALLVLSSVVVVAPLAGCTPDSAAPPSAETSAALGPDEYLPGLAARVILPDAPAADAHVVLLVPGGGWEAADFTGLLPLADALADAGVVAVTASYRVLGDGGGFPATVDDVACAARFAAQQAASAGVRTQGVTVLGHSAGGHLAALVALGTPDEFGADCPYPQVAIDGLVGLAGVYDITAPPQIPPAFLDATQQEDPQLWTSANPVGRLAAGQSAPGLPVLLLHGDADEVVPMQQSMAFEQALRQAGAQPELGVAPDVDHLGIIAPEIAAPPLLGWLDQMRRPAPTG